MHLKSYPKEYLRITLASIKTPAKFFQEVRGEGGYLKPFAYWLATYIISNAGISLIYLFNPESFAIFSSMGITFTAIIYLLYTLLMIFYIVLMHLAVTLVGGKGNFNDTFKVVFYSSSPLSFAWIFMLGMFVGIMFKSIITMLITLPLILAILACYIYIFYIQVIGISVTSGITRLRAFAALLIQLFIYAFIAFILLIVFVFFFIYAQPINSSYSSAPYNTQGYERYGTDTQDYVKYNMTVYAGSTPQIDGIVDAKDAWHEGEQIHTVSAGEDYAITTKHDFNNTYILVQWRDLPEWNDAMHLYFEQDEGKPDFDLNNGIVDNYYQGHPSYGPESMRDAHYDSGYTVLEHQDGLVKAGYGNGTWTIEWQIPMRSEDPYDIHIEKYPAQVGFSIANWGNGPAVGVWPPNSAPYLPETWGNMLIVDSEKI
ncbi:MAG TPA: YIP1 family protein [Candidatus Methanoperedens sp.]